MNPAFYYRGQRAESRGHRGKRNGTELLAQSPKPKIAIIAVTDKGRDIAFRLKPNFAKAKIFIKKGLRTTKDAVLFDEGLKDLTAKIFNGFDGIIFCMALGIVVRSIAPYMKDKHTDPAIVTIDDEAHFAVSTLSGHEGGANKLAIKAANILGAEPVITTASEAKKNLIIGIGCRRGIRKEEIKDALRHALGGQKISIDRVRYIATIDLKKDERGILDACLDLEVPLRIISSDLIKNFNGKYQRSSFVKEKIGVEGVSEPCALLAGRNPKLILPKRKFGKVTIAIARVN